MPLKEQVNGLYTDRYELSMAWTYWSEGRAGEPAVFDYFFRQLPFGGGYAVFAGLGTLVEALREFTFGDEAIDFLRKENFPADFLGYLRDFRFGGNLFSVREGEVIFPAEPVARVEGGLLETQLIETLLLNVLNFQSLIATKAARCVRAAGGRAVSEFGLRRAHGLGGLWATRGALVGGCASTSNVAGAALYGVPAAGTMAHSFVQSYDDEITAFRRFAERHGNATILLADTYDTLRSGVPNAIAVAREMALRGEALRGVRLDSGDLAYMAKETRRLLDEAGLPEVRIVVSNQLDEWVIRSLDEQEAPIDLFGIGTRLATGQPDAAFDGVYKLAMCGGAPRMKFSESLSKSTLPGRKGVTRFLDENGRFFADAIHLGEEGPPARMRHPFEPRKQLDLANRDSEPLLREVVTGGEPAEPLPSVTEAAAYARRRLELLPPEHQRLENPHTYKVGLSPALVDLREDQSRRIREKRNR